MPERLHTDVLILGAGLTGLSIAYHLERTPGAALRVQMIEKSDGVGGLARTRTRPQGFLCDGTGHWLHLRTPYAKNLVNQLLGDNLESRERRARIYSKGIFTQYPFQANTYGLPKEVVHECVSGFIHARFVEQLPEPQNYQEWIRKEFGEGISKHFMFPYNRKIYGVPLETLARDFAAKYIPKPDVDAVIKGALGLSPEALGYNASFVYPKKGGIGALSQAIHKAVTSPLSLGEHPTAIERGEKITITLNTGRVWTSSHLASTIPLPELVDLLVQGGTQVPDQIRDAKAKLKANCVLYFDVAVQGTPSEHQNYHWIYVPEDEFPFYRVGSYSAVEPSLAPPGFRSYYVEVGHAGVLDPKTYEQSVIDGLQKIGLLDKGRDLVFMIPEIIEPAYVLFDHHYTESRRLILDWLNTLGILSVGRYGRWQYNAMEDALLEGQETAQAIAGQT